MGLKVIFCTQNICPWKSGAFATKMMEPKVLFSQKIVAQLVEAQMFSYTYAFPAGAQHHGLVVLSLYVYAALG